MIYGPLLDKYGRKKPLLVGLCIYLVASLFCAYTKSADNLIILRFIQALGSCSGMVAGRAMVRDFYAPREAAKVFSLLMLVVGISPILAPSVGAFVLTHYEWHGIFIVLTLIALIILLGTIFILPESYKGNTALSLKPKHITQNYWEVFRNPLFLTYSLVGGIAASGLYAYLAGSPFVLQNLYGLSEAQYGMAFAFVASALILATQLNRFLLNHFSSETISKRACLFQATVGLIMLIITLSGGMSLSILIASIFLFLCGQGFIFPNTSALALTPFDKQAGSASALLGCMQMGFGAISSALVSILHNHTVIPMVSVMAGCSMLSLLIFLSFPKWLAKKSPLKII